MNNNIIKSQEIKLFHEMNDQNFITNNLNPNRPVYPLIVTDVKILLSSKYSQNPFVSLCLSHSGVSMSYQEIVNTWQIILNAMTNDDYSFEGKNNIYYVVNKKDIIKALEHCSNIEANWENYCKNAMFSKVFYIKRSFTEETEETYIQKYQYFRVKETLHDATWKHLFFEKYRNDRDSNMSYYEITEEEYNELQNTVQYYNKDGILISPNIL